MFISNMPPETLKVGVTPWTTRNTTCIAKTWFQTMNISYMIKYSAELWRFTGAQLKFAFEIS